MPSFFDFLLRVMDEDSRRGAASEAVKCPFCGIERGRRPRAAEAQHRGIALKCNGVVVQAEDGRLFRLD